MITTTVKLILLLSSCITLYLTKYLPGTKAFWQGVSNRKYDTFVFCLLFISVTFLVGERTVVSDSLIDTNRAIRVAVIILVIILSWWKILTSNPKVSSIPASIIFMFMYAIAALLTSIYSVYPTLTLWKSTEVIAHVSVAVMLARSTKTLEDAQVIVNYAWLGLLFLVIQTIWSALLFPDLAFKQYMQFEGMAGLYPRLNLNTASQVGASMAVGAIAMLFSAKSSMARAILIAVAACSTMILIYAHSRTSIFALAACIIVFALFARSSMFKVLAIGGTALIAAASAGVMTYMYRGQTEEQFTSLTGRLDFWELVIGKVSESPLLGYGFYSGSRVLFNVPGADNTYLTVLLGGGVILLSIFMIPLILAAYQIYSSRPTRSKATANTLNQSLWMQVSGLFIILIMRSLTGPSFDAHHISLALYMPTLIGAACLYKYRNHAVADSLKPPPQPDLNLSLNKRLLRPRRQDR